MDVIEYDKIRFSGGAVFSMKKFLITIGVLGILALGFYLGGRQQQTEQQNIAVQLRPTIADNEPTTNTPATVKRPATNTLTTTNTTAIPLPELDQSDAVIRKEMGHLHNNMQLDKLFVFDSIIRKFVVTVDNMTEAKLPQKFKFTRLPRNKFQIQKAGDGTEYIDQTNYDRYTPYVAFVESLDTGRLVGLYYQYYPLFQQAYADLGYPDRDFNNRLIAVLDHLLATPEVDNPIQLLQPKVYYTFADEELEALSGGQKLMIRIGRSNAARIKSWLQNVRQELIAVR